MPPSPLSAATNLRRSSSRSVRFVRRLRLWLRATLGGPGQDRVLAVPQPKPLAPRPPVVNGREYRVSVAPDPGVGRRALDRRAVEALAAGRAASERLAATSGWAEADRGGPGHPAGNGERPRDAARLRNLSPPVRRDGHPERPGGPDLQPRSAQTPWRLPALPPAPEPGARWRRRPGLRQSQPDLHVINGEGKGTASGRRARLRPVQNPLD